MQKKRKKDTNRREARSQCAKSVHPSRPPHPTCWRPTGARPERAQARHRGPRRAPAHSTRADEGKNARSSSAAGLVWAGLGRAEAAVRGRPSHAQGASAATRARWARAGVGWRRGGRGLARLEVRHRRGSRRLADSNPGPVGGRFGPGSRRHGSGRLRVREKGCRAASVAAQQLRSWCAAEPAGQRAEQQGRWFARATPRNARLGQPNHARTWRAPW